jgi:hypothetical protein
MNSSETGYIPPVAQNSIQFTLIENTGCHISEMSVLDDAYDSYLCYKCHLPGSDNADCTGAMSSDGPNSMAYCMHEATAQAAVAASAGIVSYVQGRDGNKQSRFYFYTSCDADGEGDRSTAASG